MSTQVKIDQPFPIVAVSGDSEEKAHTFAHESNQKFEVVYGLSDEQARNLGLYSNEVTSVPFCRPDLETIKVKMGVIQE